MRHLKRGVRWIVGLGAILLVVAAARATTGPAIRAAGTLNVEGHCRILTDDGGHQFALVGPLESFTTGDRIVVTGTVGEPSGCIEGTTIRVEKARPDLPRRAARQTSLAGFERGLLLRAGSLTGTG